MEQHPNLPFLYKLCLSLSSLNGFAEIFPKHFSLVLVHIAGSQTEYVILYFMVFIYVNDDKEGLKLVTLSVSLLWLN